MAHANGVPGVSNEVSGSIADARKIFRFLKAISFLIINSFK